MKISDTRSAILTRDPPEALRPWVTGFVLRDQPGRGQAVRLLPEPRASIQIVLGDPYWLRGREPDAKWHRAPGVALWGPRYAWAFGWPQGHIRIFGVGLTPMALRAVLGGPAAAAVDRVLPLTDVLPALAQALEVLPAHDVSALSGAASVALAHLFVTRDARDPIAPKALDCLATHGGGAVADAARLCGLSERHFRRVFEDLYGATPKLYQRVRRVDRMMRSLHPKPWETDVLRDHGTGFADQPHLIREFQALTGLTPDAYARAMARSGGPVLRSVAEEGIAPPGDSLGRN